ncbi:hypothetical protein [Biostraticola tofi]|uniref:hypothetical protein n=1 Tax=Biostraticola tofi TaxID=466109 RepID=UPI0014047FCA|nr:hypothetical protein [Biostraticola tofi]
MRTILIIFSESRLFPEKQDKLSAMKQENSGPDAIASAKPAKANQNAYANQSGKAS